MFRARSFTIGMLASVAFLASFASYMFTLALLLQADLGLEPFHAGLAFAPAGLGYATSALLAPRLTARYGSTALVCGALLAALGLVGLGTLAADGGTGASIPLIVAAAAVISIGNGVILPSVIGSALRDVPPRHAGAAAGALSTAQQFASAAGVAGIGTIFFTVGARSGFGIGMAWSAGTDAALLVLVASLITATARHSRR